MTLPMKSQAVTPQTVEDVLIKGDLASLNPEQRKEYYLNVCRSLGLNPLTQPFTYLTLNGKLTLYPNKTCSDQLSKNNGISIKIVSQDQREDVLITHVQGRDKDGREDENIGAIYFPATLKGEARANALMKGVTKAKRRLILGMSGLGWPDETEVEDIPKAAKGPPVDPDTGEVLEPVTTHLPKVTPPSPAAEALTSIAKHSWDGAPHCIILPDNPDWIAFGQQMIEYAKQGVGESWRMANNVNLTAMEQEAPKVYARMIAAIKKLEINDNP